MFTNCVHNFLPFFSLTMQAASSTIWQGFMYLSDRNDLVNNKMISDAVIDTSMAKIKQQYGVLGMESTLYGRTLTYRRRRNEDELPTIQIHHTGEAHWVTSAKGTRDGDVKVYDSMANGHLSVPMQEQISCVYGDREIEDIKVIICGVQQQKGYTDCGLFAIAFALELANSKDPATAIFNQKKMRGHLLSCLEFGTMKRFPKQRCLTIKSETATIFINTDFCICALPVSIDSVVTCNGCKRAFHKSCLGRRYDGLEFKCWKCAGKTTPLIVTLPAAYNSHLRPL